MANIERHRAKSNHLPRGSLPGFVPRQPDAPQQNFGAPPAAPDIQLEGHMPAEGMAAMVHVQPVGGVAEPGMPQDADMVYYGIVDYHPQPLHDPPVPYIFPDAGIDQGVHALGQPNALDNQEHDVFDFVPQHIPPFPGQAAQAALDDPFAYRNPAPQPAAENLRILADRFLHHRNSQVDLVSMEPGAAGLCRVVIILELADIL